MNRDVDMLKRVDDLPRSFNDRRRPTGGLLVPSTKRRLC